MFNWTEAAVTSLNSMVADRHTSREIAVALSGLFQASVTRNSIISKCHREGISLCGGARREKKVYSRKGSFRSVPAAAVMPVEPLLIPLVDLEKHHCREVVTPDGVTASFCGHPKKAGSSFCAFHHAINWMPAVPRKQFVRAA